MGGELVMSSRTTGTAGRHDAILALLARQQRVHVSDLATRLDVSEETIRRDLVALEASGNAVRVHGGAIVPTAAVEAAQSRVTGARGDIAEAVIALMPTKGSVFFGSGDVSRAIAEALPDDAERTIITPSVEIALLAAVKPFTVVYNLGGAVRAGVAGGDAQFGPWTDEQLQSVRVDVAVIEVSALGSDGEVLSGTPQLAEQVRCALAIAERRVLVVTGAGDEAGSMVAAGLLDFDDVVAADPLPRALASRAAEGGLRMVLADGGRG